MNKYDVVGVIGEGAYGVVIKCRNKLNGEFVAIKKFKETENDESARRTILREVKILKALKHDNIVHLKEAFRRKGKLYIVFEYVNATLLNLLEKKQQGLDSGLIKVLTWQLIQAAGFCHQNSVMHRDIKPENLLIDTATNKLKLCDFGFARPAELKRQGPFSNGSQRLTDYVATRWYRAPELLLGSQTYGKEVDMWAIGCILGEIIDGEPLFPGDTEYDQLTLIEGLLGPFLPWQQNQINSSARFKSKQTSSRIAKLPRKTLEDRYRGKTDDAGIDLMRKLLHLNPSARLTWAEALGHPFFQPLWEMNPSLQPPPVTAAQVRTPSRRCRLSVLSTSVSWTPNCLDKPSQALSTSPSLQFPIAQVHGGAATGASHTPTPCKSSSPPWGPDVVGSPFKTVCEDSQGSPSCGDPWSPPLLGGDMHDLPNRRAQLLAMHRKLRQQSEKRALNNSHHQSSSPAQHAEHLRRVGEVVNALPAIPNIDRRPIDSPARVKPVCQQGGGGMEVSASNESTRPPSSARGISAGRTGPNLFRVVQDNGHHKVCPVLKHLPAVAGDREETITSRLHKASTQLKEQAEAATPRGVLHAQSRASGRKRSKPEWGSEIDTPNHSMQSVTRDSQRHTQSPSNSHRHPAKEQDVMMAHTPSSYRNLLRSHHDGKRRRESLRGVSSDFMGGSGSGTSLKASPATMCTPTRTIRSSGMYQQPTSQPTAATTPGSVGRRSRRGSPYAASPLSFGRFKAVAHGSPGQGHLGTPGRSRIPQPPIDHCVMATPPPKRRATVSSKLTPSSKPLNGYSPSKPVHASSSSKTIHGYSPSKALYGCNPSKASRCFIPPVIRSPGIDRPSPVMKSASRQFDASSRIRQDSLFESDSPLPRLAYSQGPSRNYVQSSRQTPNVYQDAKYHCYRKPVQVKSPTSQDNSTPATHRALKKAKTLGRVLSNFYSGADNLV